MIPVVVDSCARSGGLGVGAELNDSSKILPTAIATGGDIGLSNLSLKTITLSLYSKSSSFVFDRPSLQYLKS